MNHVSLVGLNLRCFLVKLVANAESKYVGMLKLAPHTNSI